MSTVLTPDVSTDLDTFVALSALLTGIAATQLKPLLDTHGTAQTYFDIARMRGGADYATLANTFAQNKGKAPADQGAAIFPPDKPEDRVVWLARSIMLLWYLAAWYDPDDLPKVRSGAQVPFFVVSADAYTQSWVWRVGQTHPMGYSDWRFGYWHQSPPPLSAFVGGAK